MTSFFLMLLICWYPCPTNGAAREPEARALGEFVRAYFETADAKRRDELTGDIITASKDDWRLVAETFATLQLWPMVPRDGTIIMPASSSQGIRVLYQVPNAYDPSKRYPLLICLPHAGAIPEGLFGLIEKYLGDVLPEFVVVVPSTAGQTTFHRSSREPLDVRELVRAIRRQIHVDTDRTYLMGLAEGGDAAWMAALAHPDLFAGVISHIGYPPIPYPDQVYPFYLENLRSLPVLTVWHVPSERWTTGERVDLVHRHNSALVDVAHRNGLPIHGAGLEWPAPEAPMFPSELAAPILVKRRPSGPRQISHWFRYPSQGHAGWLRVLKIRGEVWEDQQLSIAARSTVDFDAYVREVIQSKLAYMGGRIEGQLVEVETRGCERIEVMLGPDLVDFERPMTITINGTRRLRDKIIRPDIPTMLTAAYEGWDFQRLILARMSFTVKSDATDD
jgi:pimeloyl-ACP methyl ester carboxylesterase